ncbi:MAG: hypothetical protein HYX68_27435 [Planctomycetes bacterium]|jgi:hypothetical protein|nr:hypothetical protein [Planctomycetota bacterium]
MTPILEREEYIEQVYFFRTLRERAIDEKMPAQEVLERIHEEVLSITRLPMAIQFLATELKHSGLLASGFARLGHYFTPFQAFVIDQAEDERNRFSIDIALLVLEREAQYRSGTPTPAGLFVYEFETLSRNRLGYEAGLRSMAGDSFFDADWRSYLDFVRRQMGAVDFTDLIYVRSEWYITDQRRQTPDYAAPVAPLFGEKEGKIAKANRGRDPLYLFAALQRQLGYPEVPRIKRKDDVSVRLAEMQTKIKELEARLKLVEAEQRGKIDLSEFMAKPELLIQPEEEE